MTPLPVSQCLRSYKEPRTRLLGNRRGMQGEICACRPQFQHPIEVQPARGCVPARVPSSQHCRGSGNTDNNELGIRLSSFSWRPCLAASVASHRKDSASCPIGPSHESTGKPQLVGKTRAPRTDEVEEERHRVEEERHRVEQLLRSSLSSSGHLVEDCSGPGASPAAAAPSAGCCCRCCCASCQRRGGRC